jgi:hypothetical protein
VQLMHQFQKAKNFGSLIQPCVSEADIAFARGSVEARNLGSNLFLNDTHKKVLSVLAQAEALTQRYQIVTENPPYAGSRYMNGDLAGLAKKSFRAGSSDLFSMFIIRSLALCQTGGVIGIVCPFVWMFLSAYEAFRKQLLVEGKFNSMVRLEYNAFEPACVPVSAWVYSVRATKKRNTRFIDLSEFRGWENQAPRTLEAINDSNLPSNHFADCDQFLAVPGAPFTYEVSAKFRAIFAASRSLADLVEFTGSQNVTGENRSFVRKWWEVPFGSIGQEARWVFYGKGGGSRKWWGLLTDIVDWSLDAREFYAGNKTSNLLHRGYWFRAGITYSELTSNQPTFRLLPEGCVYDKAGPSFHPVRLSDTNLLLALCNSSFASKVFDVVNPTLHVQVRDVKSIPLPSLSDSQRRLLDARTGECVRLAKNDWDSYELSPYFQGSPFCRPENRVGVLRDCFSSRKVILNSTIRAMQDLETENNRVLLQAYELDGELSPEVAEQQVSLSRAEPRADMVSFLSYALGCMMGRYSLDRPGLILADKGDGLIEYAAKTRLTVDEWTFTPDRDGMVPVLDGEWFADDVVARTREFLKVTFGEASLRENIRFIEESLERDLRSYFLTDFYKDHLQTYKKRPIYWMVQSPRKGFSVLIYLHRYTRDTMNVILNRYLRDFQVKLRSKKDHLQQVGTSASASNREKTLAAKELIKLRKTLHECEEWERQTILPLAQARIELDLDDGVKVNYQKLGEALVKIPGFEAAEE